MRTHTAGPWHLTINGFDVYGPCEAVSFDGSKYSPHLASTHSDEQGKTNARLICASPELLAACKKALLAFRATSKAAKDYSPECELLKAAIDKAEGQAVACFKCDPPDAVGMCLRPTDCIGMK